MEQVLAAFFIHASAAVSKHIVAGYKKLARKADEPSEDELEALVEELEKLGWDKLVPTFVATLGTVGTESNAAVYAALNIATDTSLSFGLVNKSALAYANDRAAELVGKKWVGGELVDNPNAQWAISDTTRSQLEELITDAFEHGMSPTDLSKAIQEAGVFSKARATMIAQTETGFAHMAAAMESAETNGATEKKVLLSNLEACPICTAYADLGKVAFDYEYAPEVTGPLFHPNCHCGLRTYL